MQKLCHNKINGGLLKFPAIAKKNYEALKENAHYNTIVQLVLEQLLKTSEPARRAQIVHELVDHFNTSVFQNEVVQQMSPCRQGCAFCCHNEVSVTEDEIELIVKNHHHKIDLEHLRKQKENYSELPFNDRKCVFLDENNSCSIYADRPSVCRTNAVIGDPQQCIESKNLRLVNTFESDMAIYAHFLFSKKSGILPELLFDKLAEQK